MNVITKTLQLADGRTITIETGKVAKQTDGSVVLRMNNTVLLATVCAAKDAVPGTDFMPLQVDYREQYSAAGRFPGGFTKREGKASDNEILTSRLVDRVLRPLFPSNYHAEVFVNVMLLSADGVDQPDALAGFAFALSKSAGETSGCAVLFTIIYLQRHKICSGNCIFCGTNSGEQYGIVHTQNNRAVGLFCHFPGFNGDGTSISQLKSLCNYVHLNKTSKI